MQQYASDFLQDLQFSVEASQLDTDKDILRRYFPEVDYVQKTGPEIDRLGVDYIVGLTGGTTVYVDVKTRRPGASKGWPVGSPPLLALEHWSQYWGKGDARNRPGWTLDIRKQSQYIMYKFDPEDSLNVYIFPFLQLNKAFRHNFHDWRPLYERGPQRQARAGYVSRCMLVPADVVIQAVTAEFTMEQVPLPF